MKGVAWRSKNGAGGGSMRKLREQRMDRRVV